MSSTAKTIDTCEISAFEKIYTDYFMKKRRLQYTVIKYIGYFLLCFIFLWPVLAVAYVNMSVSKAALIMTLSAVVMLALVAFLRRYTTQFTVGNTRVDKTAVIKKVTRRVPGPNGSGYTVDHYYIDGTLLFLPPGTDSIVDRYEGQAIHVATVEYHVTRKRPNKADKELQQAEILLAIMDHGKPVIDMGGLMKNHGTKAFIQYYSYIIPAVTGLLLLFGPLIYYYSELFLVTDLSAWVYILIFIGGTVAAFVFYGLLVAGYELLRKKINPNYQSGLEIYRQRLTGLS